jgi:hypothetical protein
VSAHRVERPTGDVRALIEVLGIARGPHFDADEWLHNQHLVALRAALGDERLSLFSSPPRGEFLIVAPLPAGCVPPSLVSHARLETAERMQGRLLVRHVAAHCSDPSSAFPFAYPVFFRVPPERAAEFNAWYDDEHLAILLQHPGWKACDRYELLDPGEAGPTHLALHWHAALTTLTSPERSAARATPWRDRLAAEPWFRGDYRVYHRCVSG